MLLVSCCCRCLYFDTTGNFSQHNCIIITLTINDDDDVDDGDRFAGCRGYRSAGWRTARCRYVGGRHRLPQKVCVLQKPMQFLSDVNSRQRRAVAGGLSLAGCALDFR